MNDHQTKMTKMNEIENEIVGIKAKIAGVKAKIDEKESQIDEKESQINELQSTFNNSLKSPEHKSSLLRQIEQLMIEKNRLTQKESGR